MTIFDIIIIFILGICLLLSFFKGMVREIFSLFGYLTGYVLAINYNDELAITLQSMVSQEIMARITGFTIIFVVVKIVVTLVIFFAVKITFGILGRLFRKFVDGSTVLSYPDRLLGGAVGLIKGLIIVAIILFPLSLFENNYKKITQGSVLAPYFEKMIHIISKDSYTNNLIDRIPKLSTNDVKKSFKQMGDLDNLTQEALTKKDDLLKSVQGLINKEKTQEDYTDEDKNKLNDLLNILSKE